MFASCLENYYVKQACNRMPSQAYTTSDWKAKGSIIRTVAIVETCLGLAFPIVLQIIAVLSFLFLPIPGGVGTILIVLGLVLVIDFFSGAGLIEVLVGVWKATTVPDKFANLA